VAQRASSPLIFFVERVQKSPFFNYSCTREKLPFFDIFAYF